MGDLVSGLPVIDLSLHAREGADRLGDDVQATFPHPAVGLIVAFGRPFHGSQSTDNLFLADLHRTADRALVRRAIAQRSLNQIFTAEENTAALRTHQALAAADAEEVGAMRG